MGYADIKLKETEKASETVLSLPVNPVVTREDVDKIINLIKNEMWAWIWFLIMLGSGGHLSKQFQSSYILAKHDKL